MKTKEVLITIGLALLGCFLLLALVAWYLVMVFTPHQYTTNDIADYANFTGNIDNDFPQEYITGFFPDEIQENFADVHYSYRAQDVDTYAFEAYLEFTIEDPQEFEDFIERYTSGIEKTEFIYDSNYVDCTIDDILRPNSSPLTKDNEAAFDFNIRFAQIGKILYSTEQQRIIFVAMGVYDGGVATTEFLTVYFDRFDINPAEYAKNIGAQNAQ